MKLHFGKCLPLLPLAPCLTFFLVVSVSIGYDAFNFISHGSISPLPSNPVDSFMDLTLVYHVSYMYSSLHTHVHQFNKGSTHEKQHTIIIFQLGFPHLELWVIEPFSFLQRHSQIPTSQCSSELLPLSRLHLNKQYPYNWYLHGKKWSWMLTHPLDIQKSTSNGLKM